MVIINWIIRLFKQKNKGFKPSKVLRQIKKDQREGKTNYSDLGGELEIKFGGFSKVNPGGQWMDYTPDGEIQKNNIFDSFGCTMFNTENPIQTYMKKEFGISEEYSERYNGVLSNIRIGFGGSPHTVAESIRKYGLLPYTLLPFDDTITSAYKYYSPKPMTQNLIKEGQKWLDRFDFGHEWIWDFSHENMKRMLEYSPLGVGVYAWVKNSQDIYYKPSWARDNHWTSIIGYKEGEYWIVYDSYKENGTFIKQLDWNYPFGFAKRYYLGQKDPNSAILKQGKELYEYLKKKRVIIIPGGEVYSIEDNYQLKYEFWTTDSKWFQSILDTGLRAKELSGEFIGISRDDFDKLKQACVLGGGGVYANPETINKLKGLIKELTK